MPNNRKFRDCSALSVTCFKIVMTTTYFWPPIRFFASRWNSISHNSAKKTYHFTLQLKFLVSLLSKPKEILDWNVCQVTVTESIVVFLQSRSSIYIFTDSLFFLLCLFPSVSFCVHWAISQFFPRGSLTQMAGYNREFRSRLIANGFAFSFGQHESVGTSLTFRVSVYRWRNTVSILFCSDLKWIAIKAIFAVMSTTKTTRQLGIERALHRYHKGYGFKSSTGLNFFQVSFPLLSSS